MKKFFAAVVAGALTLSVLTGCAPASTIVPNTKLNIGEGGLAQNLNTSVSASGQTAVSHQNIFELTQSSFYSLDASGKLAANELFGTAEISNPAVDKFTVDYTVESGVTWNDGSPVTAADLLVSWVAAVNPAKSGFQSVAQNSGLANATAIPKISNEGQTLSVVFDQPIADWQTALKLSVPAHLLGKSAFGESDAGAASDAVVSAIQGADSTKLAVLATKFNTAWQLSSEPLAADLYFSSGAYNVDSATNTEVVLKANPKCTWCRQPKVETVTLKLYDGTEKLLSAMAAGDVDLSKPAESENATIATIVPAIEELKANGYKYTSVPSGRIEALILSYSKYSVFGPKSDFGAKKAAKIRSAFLKLVPRQRILDNVSIPVKLTRADSFVYPSSSRYYTASVQENGSASYRFQNVEKAAEIMRPFKLLFGVRVNMVFDPHNFREAIVYNLIAQNAKDAKIAFINKSGDDFDKLIRKGDTDVYVTDVPLLGTDTSALGSLLTSKTGFSSQEVQDIISSLAADPQGKKSSQSYADLDTALFKAGYGLPLYELPALVAFNSKLEYYQPSMNLQSLVWGYPDWNVEPEKKQ